MINEIKAILQIACLTVLLIASILASVAFFRLYGVLNDFRDSFIFQPVAPAGLEAVESIVEDLQPEQVETLPEIPKGVPDIPTDSVPEVINEIGNQGISRTDDGEQEETLAENDAVEEAEALPRSQESKPTVQEVDTRNICDRTPEIQQILIERLQIKRCRDITTEELWRIRNLELSGVPLRVGDLDGLINLTSLHLAVEEVPEGLLDDLASLEYLGLRLQVFPSAGLFQHQAALRELTIDIESKEGGTDPDLKGIFEGLEALKRLEIDLNDGSQDDRVALVQGSLTGMPELQELAISNISRVERGIFSELPALRSVNLSVIYLPDHLTKPSFPMDSFAGNPDLGNVYLSGFQDVEELELNSLNVVCRMSTSGPNFRSIVQGSVVEVVDYYWSDEASMCSLRKAPVGSEVWDQVEVTVPHLPELRRN